MHLAADVVVFRQTSKGGEAVRGRSIQETGLLQIRDGAARGGHLGPLNGPRDGLIPDGGRGRDGHRQPETLLPGTARDGRVQGCTSGKTRPVCWTERMQGQGRAICQRTWNGCLEGWMSPPYQVSVKNTRWQAEGVPGVRHDLIRTRQVGRHGGPLHFCGRWAAGVAKSLGTQGAKFLHSASLRRLCARGGGGANEGALILAAPIPQRGRWGSLVNAFLVHRYMY